MTSIDLEACEKSVASDATAIVSCLMRVQASIGAVAPIGVKTEGMYANSSPPRGVHGYLCPFDLFHNNWIEYVPLTCCILVSLSLSLYIYIHIHMYIIVNINMDIDRYKIINE